MLQFSGIKNENSIFKWNILFYYLMVENQNIENKPTYGICKEFILGSTSTTGGSCD